MSHMLTACANWLEYWSGRRGIGSGRLPVPGEQGLELAAPSGDRQVLEYVLQVGQRLHAIELSARKEGVHHRRAPAAGLGATKEPIVAFMEALP
jgi:hypothetical protein